jgi:L-lactate dehydrogenase complex protein LldG
MTSREKILNQVRQNKPAAVPLPQNVNFASVAPTQRLNLFTKSLQGVGAVVHLVPDLPSVGRELEKEFPGTDRILNTIPAVGYGLPPALALAAGHVLRHLELGIVQGSLGVAENGAIWVSAENLPTRVLPFICEHLILVISADKIVGTMHEAYAVLPIDFPDYGVFISGPSRTADIEQSLVIGAHGPKRAHVFIIAEGLS